MKKIFVLILIFNSLVFSQWRDSIYVLIPSKQGQKVKIPRLAVGDTTFSTAGGIGYNSGYLYYSNGTTFLKLQKVSDSTIVTSTYGNTVSYSTHTADVKLDTSVAVNKAGTQVISGTKYFTATNYFQNISSGATVKTGGYTVATLPAGTIGMRAYVTDALAPTFLGVLVGGGAVVTPCFYNGTNWVAE